MGIRIESENGDTHRILGTVYADGLPRVLRVDRFNMDMVPAGDMVMIQNKDMPGVIGTVGSTFGAAGINIADMVISRDFQPDGSAQALMVLKTDSPATEKLVADLRAHAAILKVKAMRVAVESGK